MRFSEELDEFTLTFLVCELGALVGRRVGAARAGRRACWLSFGRELGVHVVVRGVGARVTVSPPPPYDECPALADHLLGARFEGVTQVEGDRVLRLDLARANPIGERSRLALWVELTGKRGNVHLVKGGRILWSLVRVGRARSVRPAGAGVPFAPLQPKAESALSLSGAALLDYLDRRAPTLADELRARDADAPEDALSRMRELPLAPVLYGDEDGKPVAAAPFPYRSLEGLPHERAASFSEATERLTASVADEGRGTPRRARPPVEPPLARAKRLRETAQRLLEEAADRGSGPCSVETDGKRFTADTPRALADKLFVRAKRLERAGEGPLLANTARSSRSPSGFRVVVGRSAEENERITAEARRSDYIFHARGVPGPHVVLVTGGREPDARDIAFAARLALSGGTGTVSYARKAFVKRPRKRKPGTIVFVHEDTVTVK